MRKCGDEGGEKGGFGQKTEWWGHEDSTVRDKNETAEVNMKATDKEGIGNQQTFPVCVAF